MNLPVDLATVATAAFDVQKAQKTVVSVNLLIDESATPEFQTFVRSGFNSDSPNSRLTMSYFPTQPIDVGVSSDLTVLVAGDDAVIGEAAEGFRASGSAVLVVAQDAEAVLERARQTGHALADADVVGINPMYPLDDEAKKELGEKIGVWIVRNCDEKRLAFSIAYPFVRRPLANEAVNATAIENAGVGFAAIIPGADMPVMTANQFKMVLQIAAAYGQSLSADRAKELAAVTGGAFALRTVARNVVGTVPVLGWAAKAGIAYAGTQAMGHAAIEYFENGGNVSGVFAVLGKTRDSLQDAVGAVKDNTVYQLATEKATPVLKQAGGKVLDVAGPVVDSVSHQVFDNVWKILRGGKGSK